MMAFVQASSCRQPPSRHSDPTFLPHSPHLSILRCHKRRRVRRLISTRQSSERLLVVVGASQVREVTPLPMPGAHVDTINMVYKFGGSSLANASRMEEVADIICSFPEYYPCVVLSAMGHTTNLLLSCGKDALKTDSDKISKMPELLEICALHLDTADELGVSTATKHQVHELLKELEQLLTGIAMLKELSPKAQDTLVSFGERLSTRVFTGYLLSRKVAAAQFDAFSIGFTSTDDFTHADILLKPTVEQLRFAFAEFRGKIPVVTGFLAQGVKTGAITTLGRGGSDLSATILGLALNLPEVQIWKDVDGILTSDPRIVPAAKCLPTLTYEEANELAFFGAQVLHPRAMKPAAMSENAMAVRVKNSYNRGSPGTLIQSHRDLNDVLLTSIVVKKGISVVDVVSTNMVGEFGFLADVFEVFKQSEISVDVVATSEISVSITLDIDQFEKKPERSLKSLKAAFYGWAEISVRRDLAIISLICNIQRTSEIMEIIFNCLSELHINVQMMSQGASKTNISLIIDKQSVDKAVQTIHNRFF